MFIYSKKNKSPGFYVYAYLRPDGTPYYIGKGKDGRAWNEKAHRVKVPSNDRIILLEKNLTNLGALALERRMIRWYGRKDINTGILRNLTDGGDGGPGAKIIITESKRKKCSERMLREHQNPNSCYKSKEVLQKKSVSMKIIRADKNAETKFNTQEYHDKIKKSCTLGAMHLRKKCILINPSGVEYYVEGISDFCRNHSLNKGAICAVVRGEIKHHKGWTARKI